MCGNRPLGFFSPVTTLCKTPMIDVDSSSLHLGKSKLIFTDLICLYLYRTTVIRIKASANEEGMMYSVMAVTCRVKYTDSNTQVSC